MQRFRQQFFRSLVDAWHAQEVDGKISFNNHCRTCYSVRQCDNRLGPSLFGIVGVQARHVAGYAG